MPYVQRLELEYHFPAYTGLEPEKIEDGGDIAVLRGTEVRLKIFPTMKSKGGRIALNEKESVNLTPQADGTFTASFVADQDGFYKVEFDAPNGERVVASPQYTIDVLADQPPTVSFNRPGRDTSVSPIEEVFAEANAVDDYGITNLELVYSVNGGPEKVVKLFNGTKRLPEVAAGHTFYLEELGVQPGDAVSYYARASDNGGGRREPGEQRSLLPAHSSVQEGLPSGAVAGRRRWRWRRRWWAGRSALRAAASGDLGDVQRAARSQEGQRRQAARELEDRRAVAVEAARAGRRSADAHQQPVDRARSGVREGGGAAAAGRDRDEGSRRQAERGGAGSGAAAGEQSAADSAEG